MKMRDGMSRDFRIVDADWPLGRALGAVSGFTSSWIVVRRRDQPEAEPIYYLFDRATVLGALRNASAGSARQALNLLNVDPATIVGPDEAYATAGLPQVVLWRRIPAGVIAPSGVERRGTAAPAPATDGGTMRGGPARRGAAPAPGAGRGGGGTPLAARDGIGAREPDTRTRSAVTRSGSVVDQPAPPPDTAAGGAGVSPPEGSGTRDEAGQSAVVTRHLIGSWPASVEAGRDIGLLVKLTVPASPDAPGRVSAVTNLPVGTTLDIVVEPLEGVSLSGDGIGTLQVQDPQPEKPLLFRLKAGEAGKGRVRVHAFNAGFALVTLELSTTIGARQETADQPAASAAGMALTILPRKRPDLSMYIFESGKNITFRLQSADGRFEMQTYEPVQLVTDSREHFRDFFSDIDNLPLGTPNERQTARRRLEQRGSNLFNTIFPAALKETLWELRDQIKTVQITSDEAWIPWEVCRMTGRGPDGRVMDGKFFAEAFSVTRWLYGVSAASRLRFRKGAVVVSQDAGLPKSTEERDMMLAHRCFTEVPARYVDLLDAMAGGDYDAWHFTGHARAAGSADADQAVIELENRETLTPEDIAGSAENVLRPRPFVFLNACQSAQGGLTLTGVGGWANRFLKPNSAAHAASAFIGSYWSVYDDAANAFAKKLYEGLFAGKSIGAAVTEARDEVRSAEDPLTWLAYTVYADPAATVEAQSPWRAQPS